MSGKMKGPVYATNIWTAVYKGYEVRNKKELASRQRQGRRKAFHERKGDREEISQPKNSTIGPARHLRKSLNPSHNQPGPHTEKVMASEAFHVRFHTLVLCFARVFDFQHAIRKNKPRINYDMEGTVQKKTRSNSTYRAESPRKERNTIPGGSLSSRYNRIKIGGHFVNVIIFVKSEHQTIMPDCFACWEVVL